MVDPVVVKMVHPPGHVRRERKPGEHCHNVVIINRYDRSTNFNAETEIISYFQNRILDLT